MGRNAAEPGPQSPGRSKGQQKERLRTEITGAEERREEPPWKLTSFRSHAKPLLNIFMFFKPGKVESQRGQKFRQYALNPDEFSTPNTPHLCVGAFPSVVPFLGSRVLGIHTHKRTHTHVHHLPAPPLSFLCFLSFLGLLSFQAFWVVLEARFPTPVKGTFCYSYLSLLPF